MTGVTFEGFEGKVALVTGHALAVDGGLLVT